MDMIIIFKDNNRWKYYYILKKVIDFYWTDVSFRTYVDLAKMNVKKEHDNLR